MTEPRTSHGYSTEGIIELDLEEDLEAVLRACLVVLRDATMAVAYPHMKPVPRIAAAESWVNALPRIPVEDAEYLLWPVHRELMVAKLERGNHPLPAPGWVARLADSAHHAALIYARDIHAAYRYSLAAAESEGLKYPLPPGCGFEREFAERLEALAYHGWPDEWETAMRFEAVTASYLRRKNPDAVSRIGDTPAPAHPTLGPGDWLLPGYPLAEIAAWLGNITPRKAKLMLKPSGLRNHPPDNRQSWTFRLDGLPERTQDLIRKGQRSGRAPRS